MAALFSFQYRVDNWCPDSPIRTKKMKVHHLQMERDHLNIKLLIALFVIMPAHSLYVEICDSIQINLKSIPLGWQNYEKNKMKNKMLN